MNEQLRQPKSTVARYLIALHEWVFVRQSPDDQCCQHGPKLSILGRAVPLDSLVRDAGHAHLVALTQAMGKARIVTVADGAETLCIEKVESPYAMRLTARLGERVPLHCGSTPRCLLTAFLLDTITDPSILRRIIAETRASGYVISRSEIDDGMISVVAPIWDGCDSVITAVSIAGPA